MSRLAATFATLKTAGRKGLVPYVMAGDPYADATLDIMLAMAEAGADAIDLGVPVSDPMAEGPVIQKACERALAKGIGLTQVLATVRAFHDRRVGTGFGHREHHFDGGVGLRIARTEVGDQRGSTLRLQGGKGGCDAAHRFTAWPLHDGRQ